MISHSLFLKLNDQHCLIRLTRLLPFPTISRSQYCFGFYTIVVDLTFTLYRNLSLIYLLSSDSYSFSAFRLSTSFSRARILLCNSSKGSFESLDAIEPTSSFVSTRSSYCFSCLICSRNSYFWVFNYSISTNYCWQSCSS